MRGAYSLIREATASAMSQRVASVLTILMLAGMVTAVMFTTGRTVAAEQQVLSAIDQAGTRTIQVRAEDDAGLTAGVLDRIAHIDGVEWAAVFSSATDATNAVNTDGLRVPVRYAYSLDFSLLKIPAHVALPGHTGFASAIALDQLGLPDDAGALALHSGEVVTVGGRLDVPEFAARFEPLVLIPVAAFTGDEAANILLVIAESPELVAPVAAATLSVLAVEDPTRISVEVSRELAELRSLIESELGSFSRGLVLALLATTGVLVAAILYGLVMMRRKDFGRRRALGASRGFIVALLLTQTALLAVAGVSAGAGLSTLALIALGDPLPGSSFTAGVGVLAMVTAVTAALVPAIEASRRDPIVELRVP